MSLAQGRQHVAIPGPSVMPDRVIQAMMRPAPDIYSEEMDRMAPALVARLKEVARTRHQAVLYIANGHGAWEAALANTLSRGDEVLVLSTGRFAHGWAEIATRLGARPEILDFGNAEGIDAARVAERLRADRAGRLRAVLMVHTDTSSGLRSDVAAIRAAIDAAGHPALFMVDCIASLACDRFDMDAWGVDVMVAASQKGLMTPPGLGLVFFNDKAAEARKRADCVTYYWDWTPRSRPQITSQYFGGTPPTHLLFALEAALGMIAEEGLEAIWTRHATLARAIWAAAEHWGLGGPLRLNVADPALRAHSVTALWVGSDRATALRDWCAHRAGLTLGVALLGFGTPEWHRGFRVGHMGWMNAHMVLGALATIEAGLGAVGIDHREGGTSAAARVIAGA